MRIGYACINTELNCTSNSTFRLSSYSKEKLVETIQKNIECLKRILKWNKKHKIFFFRLGSQIVPFASHPVCRYNWQNHFRKQFREIGDYIKKNSMRITMHPDQFVVINSKNSEIVEKSVRELDYHCSVLELMGLGQDCKIVIHIGGVYGEKQKAINRFVQNYKKLNSNLKKRVVIENDHRSFSLKDCIEISKRTKIPVIFDVLHHNCLNNKEGIKEAILVAGRTWKKKDGIQIIHYSDQKENSLKGSHSLSVNLSNFKKFLKKIKNLDLYIMLEVKDKEQSAVKILKNNISLKG